MIQLTPSSVNILIVDDEEYNCTLLERILTRAGFQNLHSIMDPCMIPDTLNSFHPDIVLLDLHMPNIDGIQGLQLIKEYAGESYLPVLMLTADVTPKAKQEALTAGANDFLTKPYDRTEVILRITNLLKTRELYIQLQQHNAKLEERVAERTSQLELAQMEIIELLARASEYRDDMTGMHTQRVGELSGLIAEQLGLENEKVQIIRQAAPLHDIGKIGIPDQVLLKPGRFNAEEYEIIKEHTLIGAKILQNSSFDLLKVAETIAKYHHEKWDGTGYPEGLSEATIPIEARIVAIADFYDALTHERPYKVAWTKEEAIAEIKQQSGKHFDPNVVEAIMEVLCSNKELIVANGS